MKTRCVLLAGAVLLTHLSSASFAADEEIASVTGTITLDGLPIRHGRVFMFFDDQFIGAKMSKEGKFKLKRIPSGKYKVVIEGDGVPAKYHSDERSELIVNVEKGANVHDFVLHSK